MPPSILITEAVTYSDLIKKSTADAIFVTFPNVLEGILFLILESKSEWMPLAIQLTHGNLL